MTAIGPGISTALSSCKPFSFPQTCLTLVTKPRQTRLLRGLEPRATGVSPSARAQGRGGLGPGRFGGIPKVRALADGPQGVRPALREETAMDGSLGLPWTRDLGRRNQGGALCAACRLRLLQEADSEHFLPFSKEVGVRP